MEVRAIRMTAPLGLAALVVLGNIWMAVIYAQGLALAGGTPMLGTLGAAPGVAAGSLGGGWGPLGFWGVFFGLLGANNALALLAFGRWIAAVRIEQQAQAEIRAAMRWPAALCWRQHLWLDAPAPAARRPATARLGWHLPYAAGLLMALLLPATVVSLLFIH
jgi:hypothetical protein